MNSNLTEFLNRHKWRILLVLTGLLVLILCFTIGFWKTLLIAAVVTVCYFLGRLLDKGGRGSIKAFFEAIFKDNR